MLAFSLLPEPMLIPIVREEEDTDDFYIDDFFWLHERGVDLIFIFSYFHLFRKLYLNVIDLEQETAWKSGVFVFLIFQVVVFCGLVLCCTHLSDITLTIAASIVRTFFYYGNIHWWFFTDKQLSCDTLIRLAYAHYLAAFYLSYLAFLHGIDMHYDWKNESVFDGIETELIWWDEAISNEFGCTVEILIVVYLVGSFLFEEPEALSYEIFMWGDLGLVPDVRFFGVAPHWYFRPFMAWLLVCPYHKTGLFGLFLFFFILYYQPVLYGINEQTNYLYQPLYTLKKRTEKTNFYLNNTLTQELNLHYQLFYGFFVGCALYTSSFLPYGKFYNRIGGNIGMLGAYMFVFLYLSFYFFRKPQWLELFFGYIFQQLNFFKSVK